MGALDLKKLSKGMHVNDKMKLLFEDTNKKAESDGKEHILTAQERDSIIEDARRRGEITQIRKVNELYLMSNFVSIEMQLTQYALLLSITSLEKCLMGIILKSATEEILGEMIYDMARENSKNEEHIAKKSLELRKKYRLDSVLFKGFDFFNEPVEDDSIFPEELKNKNLQPNPDIQRFFIISFKHAKNLKKKHYQMSYVLSKAPIDFVSQENKDIIKESEELVLTFINLDGTLKMLRVYKDYGAAIINLGKLKNPEFLEIIKNLPVKLDLTNEERKELEVRIDNSIKENL